MLVKMRKFLGTIVVCLVAVVFLVIFSGLVLDNSQLVRVGLWGWFTPQLSLSLALFVAFFIGVALGISVCVLMIWRLSLKTHRLNRKLKQRESELNKLRVGALRGLSS